ncbi:MAG: hypothetical protein ACE5IW_02330 [bacterium]
MKILVTLLFALSFALLLIFFWVSCAGDGSALDPLGNPLGPPRLSVLPSRINITLEKGKMADITVQIQNVGGKPLVITAIEATVPWITLQSVTPPVELGAAETFSIQATLGQASLVAGIHQGAVRIICNDEQSPRFDLQIRLEITEEILPFEPTFTNIQNFIFSPICTQCHAGATAPQGMSLEKGKAFDNIVNVRSRQKPEYFRVEPFNPDDSYVVRKLEGGPDIIGGRMPLNLTPIPADQIKAVRRWIASGAPRN